MGRDSDDSRPEDTQTLLLRELRARGMSDDEIAKALKKKKRRKHLEFAAVQSRRMMDYPINSPAQRSRRPDAEIVTAEFAADLLQVHVKTVLRMIHEGRLAATRIGKAYRIRRSDLEAFAGLPVTPAAAPAPTEDPTVTSVVDIPGVDEALARRWMTTIPAALSGRPGGAPLRAEVMLDPDRRRLKIVIVGSVADTAGLMSMIQVWMDQLRG